MIALPGWLASFLLASAPFRAVHGQAQEPPGITDVFEPGEQGHWIVEQGTQALGHCATRHEGEVSLGGLRAHHFVDQAELALPTHGGKLVQRFTVERWTDARGRPLRFDFRAQIGDARSSVEGTFADGKVECVVRQGPSEKAVTVEAPGEVFLLANNFVPHLELLLALDSDLLDPAREKRTVTMFSANTLATFPYTLTRTDVTEDGDVVLLDSLGERLEISAGRLARVEIPAQKIVFRRVDEPVERFTIEAPARVNAAADIEREEVTIADGDVSLAGTVTRLKGASGRLPAVFFLSGSGGQDREGFSSGIDVGTHEILDRLTREGFLVLRVDDRGIGGSTGPIDGIDFDDLVADGRRAVRFLKARPDVDPTRVVLIGHSEGAVSAPILAVEEPIAALVLMAAPGRPLEELLAEQLLAGRRLGGASSEDLAAFEREIGGFLAAVAAGKALEAGALAPELAAFVPARAWLASHVGRDPLATLVKVRSPILILQGGRDVQVSAERDAPKLGAALAAAGHGDHELRIFPALDHLFKVASDPPSELDYLKSRPIAPEFLDALVAWLRPRFLQ